MKAAWFALVTAIAWAVGSFFGKKGLKMAHLSPATGLLIRLYISSVVLSIIALPALRQCPQAWATSGQRTGLTLVALFEGVVAGVIGMLFYYKAIAAGDLSRVLPIAFSAPVWGALLAVTWGGEALTLTKAVGILMTFGGVVVLTVF